MTAPIVVAVDLSDASRAALEHAAGLAIRKKAALVVVHAAEAVPRVPAYGMSLGASDEERARIEQDAGAAHAARLEEWVAPLRAQQDVEMIIGHDEPDELVVATAKESGAQLIVVGRRGHSAIRRFVMGSVAQAIVRRSHVPVLVVPGIDGAQPQAD